MALRLADETGRLVRIKRYANRLPYHPGYLFPAGLAFDLLPVHPQRRHRRYGATWTELEVGVNTEAPDVLRDAPVPVYVTYTVDNACRGHGRLEAWISSLGFNVQDQGLHKNK
jgi:hypothetical protein